LLAGGVGAGCGVDCGHGVELGADCVSVRGAASVLRFRSGPGSCVIDQYRTSARSYREIACLVTGRSRAGATVVVPAATPAL
jgi:hypothetical protein